MTTTKTNSKKGKKNGSNARNKDGTEYSTRELELLAKYKHQKGLIPGSWREAGHPDRPGWGNKVTVAVACPLCKGERILATSDLQWQTTRFCKVCVKDVKKNRKAKAELKKQ